MEDDLSLRINAHQLSNVTLPPKLSRGSTLQHTQCSDCMSCDPASIQHNCCVRPTGRLQGSHGDLDTSNIASQWVHCLVFKQLCGTCCLITCAAPGSQIQVLVAATQGVHSSLAAAAAGGAQGQEDSSLTVNSMDHAHSSTAGTSTGAAQYRMLLLHTHMGLAVQAAWHSL